MAEDLIVLPNFVTKILQMQDAGLLPRDVGLHQVSVYHDDWCQHFAGKACNCDPDIRLKWSQPAVAQN